MASYGFLSICTPDHIGQASVFLGSLHVGIRVEEHNIVSWLFVAGAIGPLDSLCIEGSNCVTVESIVDAGILCELADRYTPSEFCWALKPILLDWVLDRNDVAFYFDTDILFTGRISSVIAEMGNSDILLTPHYLEPFGHQTSLGVKALSLLRAGVFNAGFVGVRGSHQGRTFLSWWAGHVRDCGRNDPDAGMCGDQRWLDVVPTIFNGCKISRHAGMNVGYWNLHERHIELHGNGYTSNGLELIFIHFSGFDVNCPRRFSTHLPNYFAANDIQILTEMYASARRRAPTAPNSEYMYHKWWHQFAKLYRTLLDVRKKLRI